MPHSLQLLLLLALVVIAAKIAGAKAIGCGLFARLSGFTAHQSIGWAQG